MSSNDLRNIIGKQLKKGLKNKGAIQNTELINIEQKPETDQQQLQTHQTFTMDPKDSEEYKKLEKKLNHQKKIYQSMKKQNDLFQQQIDQLQTQLIEKKQDQLPEIKDVIETMKKTINELKNQNENLTVEIETIRSESDQKQDPFTENDIKNLVDDILRDLDRDGFYVDLDDLDDFYSFLYAIVPYKSQLKQFSSALQYIKMRNHHSIGQSLKLWKYYRKNMKKCGVNTYFEFKQKFPKENIFLKIKNKDF